MVCPHRQARCPQLPAEWPGPSSLCQRPSASCRLSAAQELEAGGSADVLGPAFLEAQRGPDEAAAAPQPLPGRGPGFCRDSEGGGGVVEERDTESCIFRFF